MEIIRSNIRYVNVHPLERWISLAAGGWLAASGVRRGTPGVLRMLTGAELIRRGVTGQCEVYRALGVRTSAHEGHTLPYELGVRARAAVTVNQPRERVFQFWRQFENLPRFMRHVVSVDAPDGRRSHWVARGPAGRKVEWDAEIINEIPNELIAWRSLPASDVDSAGSVRFKDAPGQRGTEIHVELQYNPPAGMVGAQIARLFGREPEQEIEADLNRLKQYLETAEIATTENQPHGTLRRGSMSSGRLIEKVVA
jgi:uncharacterized membrane protein